MNIICNYKLQEFNIGREDKSSKLKWEWYNWNRMEDVPTWDLQRQLSVSLWTYVSICCSSSSDFAPLGCRCFSVDEWKVWIWFWEWRFLHRVDIGIIGFECWFFWVKVERGWSLYYWRLRVWVSKIFGSWLLMV